MKFMFNLPTGSILNRYFFIPLAKQWKMSQNCYMMIGDKDRARSVDI